MYLKYTLFFLKFQSSEILKRHIITLLYYIQHILMVKITQKVI